MAIDGPINVFLEIIDINKDIEPYINMSIKGGAVMIPVGMVKKVDMVIFDIEYSLKSIIMELWCYFED